MKNLSPSLKTPIVCSHSHGTELETYTLFVILQKFIPLFCACVCVCVLEKKLNEGIQYNLHYTYLCEYSY